MDLPEEAAHHVLEEPHSLLLHQLRDHIAQHRSDRIEPLVRRADVCKTYVIEQDFLYNEDGDRLAELGPGLHDTETQGDDLGSEEEVDDIRGVILDQRTNDTERRETEILKRARLGCRIQEGIEEERDVSCAVSL